MGKIDLRDFLEISFLQEELNRVFYAKNTGFSAVRLFFLKYITDNFVGATTKEDMQHYARIQKMLAARDVEGGPNALIPVLHIVDDYYNLNGLLKDSINEYAKELFGLDSSWNRKTATLDGFKRIMDTLAGIDLAEDADSLEKGRALVRHLVSGMQTRSDGNRFMGEFASKSEIGVLSQGILQIKEGETFLDFAAGTGTTTVLSVGNQECNIINADINRETLSIAAMLYIMNGYKHIEMNCADVLSNPDITWEADKIFVDAPIGPRTVNLRYGSGLIDCGILSVYKALECLREDGVAVVALPSSALFGTAKTHIALKRELVDKGYLQAVIALPITWFGTGVTINLLILSKQQTNNKVLFINAHNASFAKYVQKANGKMSSITKEGLDEILDIFYNNTEVEGLSSSISLQTIVNKDYDLMPTTYIKERLAEEDMTIEEIDAELEKLYAQIGVNIRG